LLNIERLRVLKTQQKVLESLRAETLERLLKVYQEPDIRKQFCLSMMVEGALYLQEKHLMLSANDCDTDELRQVAQSASSLLDAKHILPVRFDFSEHGTNVYSRGGVVLSSNCGRVACRLTLHARLETALNLSLPTISRTIFSFSY